MARAALSVYLSTCLAPSAFFYALLFSDMWSLEGSVCLANGRQTKHFLCLIASVCRMVRLKWIWRAKAKAWNGGEGERDTFQTSANECKHSGDKSGPAQAWPRLWRGHFKPFFNHLPPDTLALSHSSRQTRRENKPTDEWNRSLKKERKKELTLRGWRMVFSPHEGEGQSSSLLSSQ